jgi:large subunit ribosomal protein L16
MKPLAKQLSFPAGIKNQKMTRRLAKIRGPELVHNKLIHKQYGIVALTGGQLVTGHCNMIQTAINKKLDLNKAFSVWRIDPPARPVTKHGQGKKLGGGKGAIDHYMFPIKRGRVIIEVGGKIEYESVFRLLQEISEKLPFPARPVSQEMLDKWESEDEYVRVNNLNKLRWEWCIKNNLLNCLNYSGKYDIEFAHMGPDCR